MKRTFLTVLMASLLLPISGQAVAADSSYAQSALKGLKATLAVGFTAVLGVAAYRLWSYWTTKRVNDGADKALTPAPKAVPNKFVGQTFNDQEAKAIANRTCVFTYKELGVAPRAIYEARQYFLNQIREKIDNLDELSLCDINGNPVASTSSNEAILATLRCDEKTIRYHIAKLNMESVVATSFDIACRQVGLTKTQLAQPWERTVEQQRKFEAAFAEAVENAMKTSYAIINKGKDLILGNAELTKVRTLVKLCNQLERIKTLQHIIQLEMDTQKLQQKNLQVREQREKENQAKIAREVADKLYAQQVAAQINPQPKTAAQIAKEKELAASEKIARELDIQLNGLPSVPGGIKPVGRQPKPSAPPLS